MNSALTVKSESTTEVVANTIQTDRCYHRPQVHDLGKLELVQGLANGLYRDYSTGPNNRFIYPI